MPTDYLPDFHKDQEMVEILKDTALMMVRRAYANMCAGKVEDDAIEQLLVAGKEIQDHVTEVQRQLATGEVPAELIVWGGAPENAPREE